MAVEVWGFVHLASWGKAEKIRPKFDFGLSK